MTRPPTWPAATRAIDGRRGPSRRSALALLGGAALAAPFYNLVRPTVARASGGNAKRILFFYYPDGVPGQSQNGEPSAWHPTGSTFDFQLGPAAAPLERWKAKSVFFRGLSMGPTDAGSHPGGAKKLLTATDGGNGESIDQYLSRTVGGSAFWRHLYLGAQATIGNASGDKHVVYPSAGQSIPPEDDPRRAFQALFGVANPGGGAPAPDPGGAVVIDPVRASVIDKVLGDLTSLKARLGRVESARLDMHLDALREVENRLGGAQVDEGEVVAAASCQSPSIDTGGFGDATLYDPSAFPAILKAQLDLAVLATACGLTRVVTIQASTHTSELVMSRFAGSEMYDPGYDMRSHQASHYGASHNPQSREYNAYVQQRAWWAAQYAYLLERLDSLPDGDGTMLDSSIVVCCTEVCDGNTHLHDDMPFVVSGGACGRISTGRMLDVGYRRHGDLWAALATAMGQRTDSFGDASGGVLPGLLS
jgi:hypothetical protein